MIKSLNSKFYILNSSAGQLLIESGIAISILIVALLGILGLLSRSLGLNNVVSSQYIASNLASEGIEVMKNLIDSNIVQLRPWNEGIDSGFYEVAFDSLAVNQDQSRFLLFDSAGNNYNYQTGQPTFFKRVIEVENIGADEIKVNSRVNWQIKGVSYSVNLEDHFFNWRGGAQAGSGSDIYTNTYNGSDQGVSDGPLTFDGDFSTFMGNSGGAQGNTSIAISQHTFAAPTTINSIQYRMRAGGHCGGSYDKSADYNIYVQYRVAGVWYYLPGSQFSGGAGDGAVGYDTGNIAYSTPIANVTDILAYAYGQGHGEDRASNGSFAYIYEINYVAQ